MCVGSWPLFIPLTNVDVFKFIRVVDAVHSAGYVRHCIVVYAVHSAGAVRHCIVVYAVHSAGAVRHCYTCGCRGVPPHARYCQIPHIRTSMICK